MRYALFTFLAAIIFSVSAYAQNFGAAPVTPKAQDFDQYPSFLTMTNTLQDGTQTMLRCGYSQSGSTIVADPGFMEMAAANPNNGSYSRYQRIDNRIILSVPAQGNTGRFIYQVVEPNGVVVAKNCQTDQTTDTIQNCVADQPMITAQQAGAQDQETANQCGSLLNLAIPKMDRLTYNQQKTDVFKNTLRQKVSVLEAP